MKQRGDSHRHKIPWTEPNMAECVLCVPFFNVQRQAEHIYSDRRQTVIMTGRWVPGKDSTQPAGTALSSLRWQSGDGCICEIWTTCHPPLLWHVLYLLTAAAPHPHAAPTVDLQPLRRNERPLLHWVGLLSVSSQWQNTPPENAQLKTSATTTILLVGCPGWPPLCWCGLWLPPGLPLPSLSIENPDFLTQMQLFRKLETQGAIPVSFGSETRV